MIYFIKENKYEMIFQFTMKNTEYFLPKGINDGVFTSIDKLCFLKNLSSVALLYPNQSN